MGFPAGAQTVVLSGRVGLADGAAQRDTITITPSPARIVSATYNYIVENDPITVVPDRSTGTWSVRLLATDAATFNPSGWTYSVAIGDDAPFSVSLPAATATADLADLTPVSSDPGTYDLLVPLSSLGNSATRNVGTAAGTVAAGDDSRLSNSRTPSGAAGGDLGGTYPNPAVAAVKGVAVSATPPSSGQVLTASSSSACAWQAPSGGGGGVVPVPYIDQFDAGIIILTAQADWTPVVGSNGVHVRRIVSNVNPGDVMQFSAEFLGIGTVYELDGRIPKGDGSGASRYLSSVDDGLGISGPEGYAPWYRQLSFSTVTGGRSLLVTADQIAPDGTWTIEMVYRSTNITGTDSRLYFGNGYVGTWEVWHWPLGA